MDGTGSLFKNTIAGTCYSINKFSGSLASGLSIISSVIKLTSFIVLQDYCFQDNDFIEKRKKFMLNKP